MKSIRTSVLLLLMLMAFTLQGQDKKEEIKKDIATYFSLLQEEKIAEALDWVHPDLIGMIGKEMFLMQYEEMLKKASFGAMEIDSVSNVYTSKEKGDYALVNYQFAMDYDVSDMPEASKPIFFSSMKSQFGEAVMEGDVVKVKAKREMFAVSRNDFEGWRVLDYEKGMKMILEGIIPEEVFSHFNK